MMLKMIIIWNKIDRNIFKFRVKGICIIIIYWNKYGWIKKQAGTKK